MAYKTRFLHFKTKAAYNTERAKTIEDSAERKVFDAYISFIDEGPTICTRGKVYKCELSADFNNNVLELSSESNNTSLDFGSVIGSSVNMPVFSEIQSKINSIDYNLGWYNSDKIEDSVDTIIPIETISGSEVSLAVVGDKEYLCNELVSLNLTSIANSNKLSIIRFISGSTPTTFTYPVGTKTIGWTIPQANRTYVIYIYMGELTIVEYE